MQRRIRNQLFCIGAFTALANLSCAAKEKAVKENYQATDLPLEADITMAKGGTYSETITATGRKPTCSGISIQSLKLNEHEIPLNVTVLTSGCLIETKEYGKLQVKMNLASYSYTILVTPRQEAQFRKVHP